MAESDQTSCGKRCRHVLRDGRHGGSSICAYYTKHCSSWRCMACSMGHRVSWSRTSSHAADVAARSSPLAPLPPPQPPSRPPSNPPTPPKPPRRPLPAPLKLLPPSQVGSLFCSAGCISLLLVVCASCVPVPLRRRSSWFFQKKLLANKKRHRKPSAEC